MIRYRKYLCMPSSIDGGGADADGGGADSGKMDLDAMMGECHSICDLRARPVSPRLHV